MTIVTEDGSIRTASDVSNQDFFWAVRGGGGNFGIVTELVFQLHPQRRTVYGGRVIFTPNQIERLVEVTKAWYPNIKDDEAMIQIVSVSPAGKVVQF